MVYDEVLKDKFKRRKIVKTKNKLSKCLASSIPIEIRKDTSLLKYWRKRFRLFSKFDQGIKLDRESWYSATPEKVSRMIAKRCACDLIVDGFCGAGSNTIQFALTCKNVIAIDIDPVKIELARNNAEVYGVSNRIEFIVGDYYTLAPTLKADVVFLAPPWGGPTYIAQRIFNLDNIMLENGGGKQLYEATRKITENIAYFLPRNIDEQQCIQLAGEGNLVEFENNYFDKRLNSKTVYYGNLVTSCDK
ncbi:trimethylguanosine synthase-like [Adelges cooleyi]|uniref:trimethylguanosine synthase-like n=1 Tax=Adelges cooleyi TaxID=133065 RepID=UPI00217FEE45|nr:trimethylguanosine synthase-like [Adelges cooleyi]